MCGEDILGPKFRLRAHGWVGRCHVATSFVRCTHVVLFGGICFCGVNLCCREGFYLFCGLGVIFLIERCIARSCCLSKVTGVIVTEGGWAQRRDRSRVLVFELCRAQGQLTVSFRVGKTKGLLGNKTFVNVVRE